MAKQLQFSFMNDELKLFEVYSWQDQYHKVGFGGHIRFVTGENVNDATHKVAYDFPHWWRLCGMREVPVEYWERVHPLLSSGTLEHRRSEQAYNELMESKTKE